MEPNLTHTRKITFEVYDEHPKAGHYCVFANDTVEKTDKGDLDFIYVDKIEAIDGFDFVYSTDLHHPVKLIYCWRVKMTVHD